MIGRCRSGVNNGVFDSARGAERRGVTVPSPLARLVSSIVKNRLGHQIVDTKHDHGLHEWKNSLKSTVYAFNSTKAKKISLAVGGHMVNLCPWIGALYSRLGMLWCRVFICLNVKLIAPNTPFKQAKKHSFASFVSCGRWLCADSTSLQTLSSVIVWTFSMYDLMISHPL